ncbi:hypothetical protein ACEP6V_21605 [Pseudomonas aeruginosa]|uniref:hypothetical protein n=1 Tax=Pseudomonas aeruginosa TaxID=287 RepID=UPI001AD95C2A|nr:hypothetical protein [Pseudomonas aeruginosa]MBO8337040.1 hypothetical protein [Pseudomonas aeruginosa]HCF4080915.1 hypothetical protein [Pseudomonas aeruginosa]
MNLERTTIITGTLHSLDGTLAAPYSAEVSPCCWMYQNYGLQLKVELANGGHTFVHTHKILFEEATVQQATELIGGLRICACSKCSSPAWDPSTLKTNRKGLCEACFIAEIRAEIEADQKEEEARLKKLDARRKAEGYTHRLDAWIHPAFSDDFQVTAWIQNPTEESVKKFLKDKGCTVQRDFSLIKL